MTLSLTIVGASVVFYGAADVLSRVGKIAFPTNAASVAFGSPVAALDTSAVVEPLVPARVNVPSLGIDASVEAVKTKADGSMDTPSTFLTVAWYEPGSKPGAPGNAVFAGHVNNALTTSGVFANLGSISLGDSVVVTDSQGKQLRFVVYNIEDYPTATAPLETIFATTGPAQVVLITCAGDWDPRARSYEHRLVVFAKLAR